jgi:glucose-1-phosphate cytidylyltransferase
LKVVLFCGGLGTRLREHSETVPKPMVSIGYRPIVWYLMKHYAHFGFKDFVLCLGYMGNVIKDYFLHYDECVSNDFVLSEGGRKVELLRRDIEDWRITFVDTGIQSNIGQRLLAVRHLLDGEEMFLANYSDGLCDLDLGKYVEWFRGSGGVAAFLAVRPTQSFHFVEVSGDQVRSIQSASEISLRVNGGFFAFTAEIFDYVRPGEDLVEEPFRRLIAEKRLRARSHDGFWACMDTFKDKKRFDAMAESGDRPWEVWRARA